MLSYDPTPIIHARNGHEGERDKCPICKAIKEKHPDTIFTTEFPF